MTTTKERLRKKKIKNEKESIFLDFYPPIENLNTGKMMRHSYLKMYIHTNPSNIYEKRHNKQIWATAEEIRLSWQNKLNKGAIYTEYEQKLYDQKKKGQQSFMKYFEKIKESRYGSNYSNWESGYYFFSEFVKGELKFNELTIELIDN